MKKSELKDLAARFYEIKQSMKDLESEMDEMRDIFLKNPGQYGEYIVSVSESERESFKLKEARKNLSPSILSKISDFISKSNVRSLKVSRI